MNYVTLNPSSEKHQPNAINVKVLSNSVPGRNAEKRIWRKHSCVYGDMKIVISVHC